jgi:hypothetical protein
MRPNHIERLALALLMASVVAGCGKDAISPAISHVGPTTPQGPKATPPNVAPIARAGADVVAECASHQGATVTLTGSGSDSDGRIVLFEWFENGELIATGVSPSVIFGLGTHTLLMRVTDDQGGTNDDVVVVTIQDTTAPLIQMSIAASALWPPNHTMRLVSSAITVADACDAAPSAGVSVASNEPVNGLGDGDTEPDWLTQRNTNGSFDVWVRAERSGLGDGRVYTLTATASDHSGNTASQSGTVTVAHNQ